MASMSTAPPPSKTVSLDVSSVAAHSPVSGWRRVFADWCIVGASTAVCHVIAAAVSLLLRWLLDPAQMGIWQTLKMLLNYGNYANLGISKGATREFTIALGRDADGSIFRQNAAAAHSFIAAAKRGLNLAFTVNSISSLAYAAVLVGVGIYLGRSGGGELSASWTVGLCVAGLLAVLSRYVTFHVTILRSSLDFNITARLSVLEGALTLAVCVTAVWIWGLWGLYFGTILVMLCSLAYVLRYRAVDLHWAWDAAEIRRLIVIGAPILLAGTVTTLFRSLDKLMILSYMSEREFQLGCYSVALLVTSQLYGLGNMLSIVMGPRFSEKYGHCGGRKLVAQMAARATELQAALMTLPAALAVVAAVPILGRMLPKYQAGLPSLIWLVPGSLAMAVSLPAGQYLVAVNRQGRALVVVCIATAFGALGNHLTLTAGLGLVGVAMATTAAYLIYFILLTAVSIWPELTAAARLRYAAMLFSTVLPAMATAFLLEFKHPGIDGGCAVLLVKISAVTAVWTVTAAAAWWAGGWHRI